MRMEKGKRAVRRERHGPTPLSRLLLGPLPAPLYWEVRGIVPLASSACLCFVVYYLVSDVITQCRNMTMTANTVHSVADRKCAPGGTSSGVPSDQLGAVTVHTTISLRFSPLD